MLGQTHAIHSKVMISGCGAPSALSSTGTLACAVFCKFTDPHATGDREPLKAGNGCATHRTAKTRTSAHLSPCGGTATKYSFNAGTNRPVLPSGPVGTLPMTS